MHVNVQDQPDMLREALTVVQAYINDLPASSLTGNGPFSIPEPEVEQLLRTVCGDLDRDSPENQMYFRTYVLNKDGEVTSLAQALIYFIGVMGADDPGKTALQIESCWEAERRQPFTVNRINSYGLDTTRQKAAQPHMNWRALQYTPGPYQLRMDLQEVLSDFSFHMNRICSVLLPVADRLSPVLAPYVERAEPLREAWRRVFQDISLEEFLRRRVRLIFSGNCTSALAVIRYLGNDMSPYGINDDGSVWLYLTRDMEPGVESRSERALLQPETLEAFRLLGNADRIKMIHTLMTHPCGLRELAAVLNQNPGTISRDVKKLVDCGILTKVVEGDRSSYAVNDTVLRTVFQNMEHYFFGET